MNKPTDSALARNSRRSPFSFSAGLQGAAVLLAASCLASTSDVSAQGNSQYRGQYIFNAEVTGKDRNEYSVWYSKLSFAINVAAVGHLTGPPLAPKFTIDLYDEDDFGGDDGRDVDLTESSPTVTVGPWRRVGRFKTNTCHCLPRYWECTVTTGGIQENDVTDPLPGDWPDPRVEINVTFPLPLSLTLSAPGLPSVGAADFGIDCPSAATNIRGLTGEPIAAFSRGHDDISSLLTPWSRLNQAALYFACEMSAPAPATDRTINPGRIFVLDPARNLWPEDLYSANFEPRQAVVGTPRFLNVNTVGRLQAATDEIYFVREGSDEVRYASTGDPARTSLFLDIAVAQSVTAVAVEDIAPRGIWSQGDSVLYAVENSSVIHTWTFGKARGTFAIGLNSATSIPFSHFDRSVSPQSSLALGNIHALAVSAPGRATPVPAGRVTPYVVDYDGSIIYGPPDGGEIGFRNSPVLGAPDFRVTLRHASQGAWATLLLGLPVPAPGLALPPSLSSSRLLLDYASLTLVGAASETVNGATERLLRIPGMPGLAGAEVGFQWIVFMPPNLPVTLSDAGAVELR